MTGSLPCDVARGSLPDGLAAARLFAKGLELELSKPVERPRDSRSGRSRAKKEQAGTAGGLEGEGTDGSYGSASEEEGAEGDYFGLERALDLVIGVRRSSSGDLFREELIPAFFAVDRQLPVRRLLRQPARVGHGASVDTRPATRQAHPPPPCSRLGDAYHPRARCSPLGISHLVSHPALYRSSRDLHHSLFRCRPQLLPPRPHRPRRLATPHSRCAVLLSSVYQSLRHPCTLPFLHNAPPPVPEPQAPPHDPDPLPLPPRASDLADRPNRSPRALARNPSRVGSGWRRRRDKGGR